MKALAIIMAMMAASVMVMGRSVTNENAVTSSAAQELLLHPVVTNALEPTDNQIKTAITNGTVCRVRGGHLWCDKWSGMERGWKSDGRQCEICNKHQKRKETWEDE